MLPTAHFLEFLQLPKRPTGSKITMGLFGIGLVLLRWRYDRFPNERLARARQVSLPFRPFLTRLTVTLEPKVNKIHLVTGPKM